jgi:hypothetical protein
VAALTTAEYGVNFYAYVLIHFLLVSIYVLQTEAQTVFTPSECRNRNENQRFTANMLSSRFAANLIRKSMLPLRGKKKLPPKNRT